MRTSLRYFIISLALLTGANTAMGQEPTGSVTYWDTMRVEQAQKHWQDYPVAPGFHYNKEKWEQNVNSEKRFDYRGNTGWEQPVKEGFEYETPAVPAASPGRPQAVPVKRETPRPGDATTLYGDNQALLDTLRSLKCMPSYVLSRSQTLNDALYRSALNGLYETTYEHGVRVKPLDGLARLRSDLGDMFSRCIGSR